VHRDVTARNIMRDSEGRIVLMDFGTGLQTAGDATPGRVNIAGTPMYMAPEVLAGQPPSACSDVYSVGVLLYYLVTGKYPVEGRTMDDLRTAHMVGKRTPLSDRAPDLPMLFIQAVEHALAANPQQRCPSAGLLLQALDAIGGPRRTRTQYVVLATEVVAVAVVGLTALGAINSRVFNQVLGRSDFVKESVIDWFSYGLSATIAPTVILIFVLLALSLLAVTMRLLLAASATARTLRTTVVNAARRCHLDDLTTLSSCVLLLSASVLIATWWYFVPFLGSLIGIGNISTATGNSLAFLSPEFRWYHELYRKAFIGVTIACLVLWYPAIQLAKRKDEPINRSILAGGVAVLLLSVVLLNFPYRLLVMTKRNFEAVKWSTDSCYILGERQTHLLLFCPEAAPPRNRIVRSDDPNLKHLGFIQDIFTDVGKLK